jgi:hypothetical protein
MLLLSGLMGGGPAKNRTANVLPGTGSSKIEKCVRSTWENSPSATSITESLGCFSEDDIVFDRCILGFNFQPLRFFDIYVQFYGLHGLLSLSCSVHPLN